jgi:Lrp/AsnC ligand binding domain
VITAIVLVHVESDRIPEVAEAIADLEGVSEVYSVTGGADLIAMVRVREHEALADVIADQLSKVDGVTATETHIAFRTYSKHDLDAAFSLGAEAAGLILGHREPTIAQNWPGAALQSALLSSRRMLPTLTPGRQEWRTYWDRSEVRLKTELPNEHKAVVSYTDSRGVSGRRPTGRITPQRPSGRSERSWRSGRRAFTAGWPYSCRTPLDWLPRGFTCSLTWDARW